jgi:hypothetical protein
MRESVAQVKTVTLDIGGHLRRCEVVFLDEESAVVNPEVEFDEVRFMDAGPQQIRMTRKDFDQRRYP